MTHTITRGLARFGVVAVAAVALAACGGGSDSSGSAPPDPNATEANPPGDIPDNQVFVDFTAADGSYSVKVPEGWARQDTAGGVTFTDKLNSVTVVEHAAATAPTADSLAAAAQDAHAGAAGFAFGQSGTETRAGQPTPHATYRLDSAPDAVTGKVVNDDVEEFAYFRGGTEVDLILSGPHGADNVDPWRLVSDSFTWH